MATTRIRVIGALAIAALAVLAITAPTRAQSQTIALVGGAVYPVSGPRLDRATVLIRDGVIVSIGTDVAIPADAQRIDATGKWITPGIINPITVLGVVEIGLSGGATDQRATGRNNIAAAFRPWDAFNAASPLLPAIRNDGVTTIGIVPEGNLVSGQHALIDLANGRGDTMLRKAPAAMVVRVQNSGPAGTSSRGELFAKLRTLLTDAQTWPERRGAFDENRSRELSATPADLDALQPVLARTMPLLIFADRAAEIDSVLRLAADFNVRVILASASEAWQRAPELAAAGIPVIVGGIRNVPATFDALGSRDDNAALLRRAGVSVIFESDSYGDGNHFNAGNVRFEAGNAVGNGMSWDDALRALTLAPAEAFGVADRIGALGPNMDANVVMWSGDPFEFSTRAEAVFIRGVRVDGPSRQDELMQRYRTVPPSWR